MRFHFHFSLFLLTFIAFVKTAFIEPFTRTPLRPYSINEGYTTDYLFSVNIPTEISSNAFIEVEFPMPYQIPSACKAYIKAQDGPFTVYPCNKPSYSRYVVNIGEITSGEYQIAFEGIENPSSYLASSNFKIRTYFNQDVLVDSNEYLDAVPFLPAPSNNPNFFSII